MTISGFADVDNNDPHRLTRSLHVRASAVLYEAYRRRLRSLIDSADGLVVDVGAGVGTLVGQLCPTRAVIGVEPSRALATSALALGRPVVLGPGSALPFPDATVGVVVIERVLQHVAGLEAVLAECARVVVPGGLILVVDPDHGRAEVAPAGLADLGRQLCAWRAAVGTLSPGAAARTAAWATGAGLVVDVETFWCSTEVFADARQLTNFPEWARLAAEAGADVGAAQVLAWERAWLAAAEGALPFTFSWPITLTAARVPGLHQHAA